MIKTNLIYTCLVACLIGVSACEPPERFFIEDPDYLLYYGSRETTINKVNFKGHLKAEKRSNRLFLHLVTSNESEENVELGYLQGNLITKSGLRSYPVNTTAEIISLRPGETVIDTLVFEPINSDLLFKYAGINGDLNNQYSFSPSEIIGLPNSQNQIILFQAELNPFKRYKKEFGINQKVVLWQIETDNSDLGLGIQQAMESAAELFQKDIKPSTNFVKHALSYQVSSNEILMGGLVLSIKSYTVNDRLIVHLKVVNHQSLPLEIDTNNFAIKQQGVTIKPTKISAKDFNPFRTKGKPQFELLKGERMGYQLEFNFDKNKDEFEFIPMIKVLDADVILMSQLPMVKSTEPSQGSVQAVAFPFLGHM